MAKLLVFTLTSPDADGFVEVFSRLENAMRSAMDNNIHSVELAPAVESYPAVYGWAPCSWHPVVIDALPDNLDMIEWRLVDSATGEHRATVRAATVDEFAKWPDP